MRKPPAAFAGGGLGVAELVDPVRQAFPARTLWMLIRMAGMATAADSAGQLIALEATALKLQLCMTLNEVEQRRAGGVKQ
jgi:hypothetical protein